jgi:predicted TPR repeat methyltransferase
MSLPDQVSGRDWRLALAAINPVLARAPVTPHAAQLLLAHGLCAEAEAALREFLDRVPDDLQALQALAKLLQRLGRDPEAAEVLARAARAEATNFDLPPGDRGEVGQFLSAAYQCGPPPAAAPNAFVASLFDGYADRFETHLRESLTYRGPELLLGALSAVAGPALRDLDVLDLGCGTGLAGELFRPLARRLDGVDLSAKMLARAEAKGVYDQLTEGDLVAYLGAVSDPYHLILAADVFVYLGDLVPVFAAARKALREGGRLAFTVEAWDGPDYHLRPSRRYAHSRDYLTHTADVSGFTVQFLEENSTRDEGTRPVRSFICVLANPPLSSS